jgi:uncharacterized glyoxalase superfamily protein PhnB
MSENPPEGMPQIIPYLYYEDAGAAIEFMVEAFGFQISEAFRDADGTVLHATIKVGSGIIFVGPGMEEFGTRPTQDSNWVAEMTYVFVDDVRSHFSRAVAAGAIVRAEVHEHFGGNVQYTASDPGGHRWTFAQPVASIRDKAKE